ncbi:MAG: NAD(P)H-dependent oxidoreductase [Gemmatimonadaceae bacterium]|nr:NAD(P)H-dependent oxidoreductase [Gemmatimonadaceae bacterium]
MEKARDVAVIVGSLRKESLTRKVAMAMKKIAPPSLALDIVEIGDLRMYNQDLETDSPPKEWTTFRERIKRADALLFATPEYNRSVPGCIKNAVDVGSRPGGHGVFSGKPGAIVSVTPYGLGAFGANHHLRQALVYVNVLAMAQPEAYISQAGELVDADFNIVKEDSRKFFATFLDAFAKWIETMVKR